MIVDEDEVTYQYFEEHFPRIAQIVFVEAADRYDQSPESKGPHALSLLDFMKSGEWLRWIDCRGSA